MLLSAICGSCRKMRETCHLRINDINSKDTVLIIIIGTSTEADKERKFTIIDYNLYVYRDAQEVYFTMVG